VILPRSFGRFPLPTFPLFSLLLAPPAAFKFTSLSPSVAFHGRLPRRLRWPPASRIPLSATRLGALTKSSPNHTTPTSPPT
jgi:hypothetical protein